MAKKAKSFFKLLKESHNDFVWDEEFTNIEGSSEQWSLLHQNDIQSNIMSFICYHIHRGLIRKLSLTISHLPYESDTLKVHQKNDLIRIVPQNGHFKINSNFCQVMYNWHISNFFKVQS
ncbi:hypothetical protein JHK85_001358 [Glycine max]|nr:hypothetical protein JHK85_001358 [Glycine max]